MDIEKSEDNKEALLQLVGFTVGEEEFGVNILKVQEIIRIVGITQIPNSPYYVDGVINLRGKVIPIVDLRTRLGMERKKNEVNTRIIVVDLDGKTAGFVVDSVSEVIRISSNLTEKPPELTCGIENKFITSIVRLDERIIILLDLDEVLAV
jgi:Chemotaxis signal transduction protein